MGYLSFSDTGHTLLQPAASTESDIAHPTTSYDVRVDVDLKSLTAGRNVSGAHADSSGSREMVISNQSGDTFQAHSNNDTAWNPTGTYWKTGRWQYRFLWSGTTWTAYLRDPADGKTIDDDTGWTQHATIEKNDVSGLTDVANTPFTLMRRYDTTGWAATDWYEFYIKIDGTVASSWDGGAVTLDTGANTFTDDQAQTWTWTGTDPTQVADDQTIAVGQATETESAQFVSIGLEPVAVAESEAAQTVTAQAVISVAVGVASETEAAQVVTAFPSISLYATATQTIADVVNENDNTTDLHLSVDDNPDSPNDADWVNNAVGV